MRLSIIASLLVSCLALDAQTLQGKVVRVADGDTITILMRTIRPNQVSWLCGRHVHAMV